MTENDNNILCYRNVLDNYIPIILYVLLYIAFAYCVDKYYRSNKYCNVLEYILFFGIIIFQAFRTRKCQICGGAMHRYYGGRILPKYYYCRNCKVKINTFVKDSVS
jgi:hypothetical protein